MDINITGRNLGITDRFKSYAAEKADKVDSLADRAQVLEIKVSRHGSTAVSQANDKVELTLIGPGPVVRAESSGSDKYVAFDLALAKLLERLRRAKDRKKVHRGKHRPLSLREASVDGFSAVSVTPADSDLLDQIVASEKVAPGSVGSHNHAPTPAQDEIDDWSPIVIREKVFEAQLMSVDDALYLMELVGHDFYLFIEEQTRRPSVVYRRKGWNYGVVGLENHSALVN